MNFTTEQVTEFLNGLHIETPNNDSHNRFVELIYRKLHQMAKRYMNSERQNHTLQPTALVNEAYLDLFYKKEQHWKNRTHFYAVAAKVMRHVLIQHARKKSAGKRGGDYIRVSLDPEEMPLERDPDVDTLNDALTLLAEIAPRQSQIIELRYLGGVNMDKIANLLGLSTITVHRDFRAAKIWLKRELHKQE